ncbi:DUF4097 family beta strand repeat-containing protein [Cesiribacter sp. SM1]|uniref:DUF4097 family beta strand repeat-containing protein n=1 Tax=Cesiribacter sp. SM1 TaxID=2861196 RepID=UPI001CD32060|nr:DUF4097 family beta strand repeat-containing protein [Cesiribacter sp. SM1]
MKYKILLLLLAVAGPVMAQEFKQKVAAGQQVKIQYHKADIRIEGYKGSEIVIQASGYEAPPERAKGLRSLYNSSVDNTGIGLAVEAKEGVLLVREASQTPGTYVIRVPEGSRLSIEDMNWSGGNISVKGMRAELEVKSLDAEINLSDVSGPVVANSTSGDINVAFSEYSQSGPSMISSVASEVDISMPASAKADLVLSSVAGEIFTDLDLQMQNRNGQEANMQHLGGGNSTIRATLNGGGAALTIRSTSSNIYLRKR